MGFPPNAQAQIQANLAPTTGAIAVGQPAGGGTATTGSRSDHVHAFPAAVGASSASRRGDVAADGTSTASARADHKHGREPVDGDLVTLGQETFSRRWATGSAAPASGTLQLAYFTARKAETEAFAWIYSSTTPAIGLTYAGIGLYAVDGTGNLTLLGSFVGTGMLGAASTQYKQALTVQSGQSLALTEGNRYALGVLQVGTTPANLAAAPATAAPAVAPILAGTVTGQAALPTAVAAGSVTAGGAAPFGIVSPT
ncbi:MAG TPA: hypothetical protein VFP61_07565 [Acidimicrobiales bacterium]|nr:hypothetical protein [Acidimicrobiales bacterium]